MNWGDLFGVVLSVVVNILMFVAGYNVHRARIRQQQRDMFPYRWICHEKNCHYMFAANDVMLVDGAATEHQQEHVRGEL